MLATVSAHVLWGISILYANISFSLTFNLEEFIVSAVQIELSLPAVTTLKLGVSVSKSSELPILVISIDRLISCPGIT